MTYNLLNYQDDNNRENDFILIIDQTQPDIIIAQEIIGETGYSNFKSDVLDVMEPNIWSGAPFINQSAQQDIALFYKQDIFSFVATNTTTTSLVATIEVIPTYTENNLPKNLLTLKATKPGSRNL